MIGRRVFIAVCCLLLAVPGAAGSGGDVFRGNTHTHVFHQASCRYYNCPNCTAKFATAREAVNAGYRPCGVCEPGGARRDTNVVVDAPYVGNTNSHKFHRSSCRYAGCANCTAKFRTRDEALLSGYSPGGCCDP